MSEGEVVALASDFFNFLVRSLSEVPLEISIGSAVLLTFIWLANEIFGRLSLWRIVLITVWGMVLLDFYTPVRNLGKEQLWLVVLLVGVGVTIIDRLLHSVIGKVTMMICPHCGQEVTLTQLKRVRRQKQ
jgi:hypothetical protein